MEVHRHADRAMQFAPFAALKGYYESVKAQERQTQPRRTVSDEDAELISNTLNKLRPGIEVKVRYYDIYAYTTIIGVVSEINYPYRRLKVIKTTIPFDDIYSIEMLGINALL